MSKIGKTPIEITQGTTVAIQDKTVKIAGPKGEFTYGVPSGIEVRSQDGKLIVEQKSKDDETMKAIYGLVRATLANMVHGVNNGFEKKLELSGVGYRAQMQGNDLVLSLGFSHPVKISPKAGIKINVAENVINITGIDKALVGETAATIRAIKPPEPYKGKGIKYAGERIRRKAGKAAKAVGGAK